MKKLLLVVLLLAGSVNANDLWVNFTHTMVAADTVAGAVRRDTVYTKWMDVTAYRRFWLQYTIDGKNAKQLTGSIDSAFAGDSVAVLLQSAMSTILADASGRLDERNPATFTFQVGQCVPGSADLDTTITIATSQSIDSARVFGPFVRFAFVYKDSATATRPAIIGNTYGRRFIGRISTFKQ